MDVNEVEDMLMSISCLWVEMVSLPPLLYLVGSISWREVECKEGKEELEENDSRTKVSLRLKKRKDEYYFIEKELSDCFRKQRGWTPFMWECHFSVGCHSSCIHYS